MPTAKQQLFIAEYLKDLNATRAAIRAGYSTRTARSIGQENLTKPDIAAEIERLIAERIERTGIEADRVLEELGRLAFSDLREHVEWGPGRVVLKESEGLTDEAAAAVSEVAKSVSENGASYRIKLHDKLGALRDLAKHLGLFPKDGSSVNVNVNVAGHNAGVLTCRIDATQLCLDAAGWLSTWLFFLHGDEVPSRKVLKPFRNPG